MKVQDNTAIVIPSCDKYSDLWAPLINCFFLKWPSCPFTIYLIANEFTFSDSRVNTINVGPDKGWSSTVLKGISKIKEDNLLFWIDDAFLSGEVETNKLIKIIDDFVSNQWDFLRLRREPSLARYRQDGYGEIGSEAAYRVTLFATIWRREVLIETLREEETAWQFEVDGSKRTQHRSFWAVNKDFFDIIHGVEKGIWIRSSVDKINQILNTDAGVNLTQRRIMTRREWVGYLYRMFKASVFHVIPAKYRTNVLQKIKLTYFVLNKIERFFYNRHQQK